MKKIIIIFALMLSIMITKVEALSIEFDVSVPEVCELEKPQKMTVEEGEEVDLSTIDMKCKSSDYRFNGWTTANTDLEIVNNKFIMPSSNLGFTGEFEYIYKNEKVCDVEMTQEENENLDEQVWELAKEKGLIKKISGKVDGKYLVDDKTYCDWTTWLDSRKPSIDSNGSDIEPIDGTCGVGHPVDIKCRAHMYPNKPISALEQTVVCDINYGLVCKNQDQKPGGVIPMPYCLNYEINVYCCGLQNLKWVDGSEENAELLKEVESITYEDYLKLAEELGVPKEKCKAILNNNQNKVEEVPVKIDKNQDTSEKNPNTSDKVVLIVLLLTLSIAIITAVKKNKRIKKQV